MNWPAALATLWAALTAPVTPPAGPGGTPPLEIRARAVDISPGQLDGLLLRGTVSLSADHPEFGGFSGLLVERGHLIAVTDRGWWLLADLAEGADGLVPVHAGFTPMRGEGGEVFDKAGGDAEALTLRDGAIMVAFEQDHRIMRHLADGQLGEMIQDRRFEALGSNKGLEALATHPEGWILAFEERARRGHHRAFLLRHSGAIETRAMPQSPPYYITGADVGPDGRLYLLLRDYGQFTGVSIRIDRYDLAEDGWPVLATRQTLATYEGRSGIDNMEGLALWTDAAGRTRLMLISDDNFNLIQRTLLMDFEVLDTGRP